MGAKKLPVGNKDGLISYEEFLFLNALLAIDEEDVQVAFRLFDADGSGKIDRKEFVQFMVAIAKKNGVSLDALQRDQKKTMHGSKLLYHLFGLTGWGKIDRTQFSNFMADFKKEIIKNEFSRFCDDNGTISMAEFGLLMVGNASDRSFIEYLGSMRDSQKKCPARWSERISFQEYYHFHRTMTNFCSDLKDAMRLFANSSDSQKFNTSDLQRAARIVSGQELKDACVFVLMEIFDLNDDGTMYWYDFHAAMRHRRAMITHSVTKMSKVKMNVFERFLRCVEKSND